MHRKRRIASAASAGSREKWISWWKPVRSTYAEGPGRRRATSSASDDLPKRRKLVTTVKRPACALASKPETSRSRLKNCVEEVMRPRTSNGLPRSDDSSASSSRSFASRDHFSRLRLSGKMLTALPAPRAAHSRIERTAPRSGDAPSSWSNRTVSAP
jgi:hypothetical protein